ncbi:MAG: NADH-quinone oxidoreductase subunit A [bacterium]
MEQPLLIQWLPIFIMVGFALVFVIGNMLLSKLLGDDRPLFNKLSPYESGNEPTGLAQHGVSIHFSLVAILFILFDIEIIFMYPWAMVIGNPSLAWISFWAMFVFALILAIGYFYAWSEGVFEWQ